MSEQLTNFMDTTAFSRARGGTGSRKPRRQKVAKARPKEEADGEQEREPEQEPETDPRRLDEAADDRTDGQSGGGGKYLGNRAQ